MKHIPKKFFLALLIFALAMMILGLLNSCAPSSDFQRRQSEIKKSEVPVMHSVASPNGKSCLDYWTVTVENHQYKVFWTPNGDYVIVHDPDCKCRQKEETLFNW